jgi:predicted nucleic acid-binding protein
MGCPARNWSEPCAKSAMLVFDASAAVELLLRAPLASQIRGYLEAVDYDVHAPELFDYEVMSAVRRALIAGKVTSARGSAAIEDLRQLDLYRYPIDPLVSRVWQLRDNFSPYDAAYVAVAETVVDLDAVPVLTTDMKLARAIGDHANVPVIAVS